MTDKTFIINEMIKSIDRRVALINTEQSDYVKEKKYSLASICDARIAGLYDARNILRSEMVASG